MNEDLKVTHTKEDLIFKINVYYNKEKGTGQIEFDKTFLNKTKYIFRDTYYTLLSNIIEFCESARTIS